MSEVSAGLTLNFTPSTSSDNQIFQLEVDDNGGKKPVHIKPIFVLNWSWSNGRSGKWTAKDLTMVSTGTRRVRLYCSDISHLDITLYVNGGSAAYVGERQAKRRESFSWDNSQSNRLAYWHSAAGAEIIHKTTFFNANGEETSIPTLDTQTGKLYHAEKVIGSLIVEYEPLFYLYDITYDSGVDDGSQEAEERKMEMLTAWLAGNINDADIPPAELIALAPGRATQGSFQREFWPDKADSHEGYKEEVITYTWTPDDDEPAEDSEINPCWQACKEKVAGDTPYEYLSPWEKEAIQECMENKGEAPDIFYSESSRENLTVRVYAKDEQGQDIEDEYIDVVRPVRVTFSLQKSGGSESACNGTPATDPDLRSSIEFRFNVSDLRYLGETSGGEKIYGV
jgi:hypothetical protein